MFLPWREGQPQLAGLELQALEPDGHEIRVVLASDPRFRAPRTVPPRLPFTDDTKLTVKLAQTSPTFGGVRYWFLCPRSACRRRCAVLYRETRTNARAFACRRCVPFIYRSQTMGEADAIGARIDRLTARLSVNPTGDFVRPKGMHLRTFERIARSVATLTELWVERDPLCRRIWGLRLSIERASGDGYASTARRRRLARDTQPLSSLPRGER